MSRMRAFAFSVTVTIVFTDLNHQIHTKISIFLNYYKNSAFGLCHFFTGERAAQSACDPARIYALPKGKAILTVGRKLFVFWSSFYRVKHDQKTIERRRKDDKT